MSDAPLLQMACTLRHRGFTLRADFETRADITGLYGPSGAGKSTLLNAIAGLLRPHDGFIKLAGTPLVNVKGGWWTPPHQRRVGLVFQDNRLFPHLNVLQNLEFAYHRIPRHVRRLHPDDIISLLRLEPLLPRAVTHLSGGEARRVALGRTLLTSPRLLLLDEPLTGLDPALQRDLLNYLMDLPRKLEIPLIYVSHTRAEFLALVQHTLILRDGAVHELGPPERLLTEFPDGDETIDSYLLGHSEASPEPGYVRLRIGDQTLTAAGHLAPGTRARIAVPAHEVVLAVGEPPRTSARTLLRGTVTDLQPLGDHLLVTLDVGQPLRADITPAAARDLGLEKGTPVLALLKARTLRVLPAPDA